MAAGTVNQDVARRYALAFFALAREQNGIDQVSADLSGLARMLSDSSDLRKFIGNAVLSRTVQIKVLAELGEKAKFHALTRKFLGTLAMKRRLGALPEIIMAAQNEISRHKGETTAEVISAQVLDGAQTAAIAAALKKVLGMTVRIELKHDEAIMGGLIINVGSKMIDSSVRSKLERLHRALKSSNASNGKAKMREVA